MSSHKLSSIKIPPFNKEHYSLWKKKMLLFIKASNPMYLDILKHGPFIPMIEIGETTNGTEIVPAKHVPKDPSKYTDPEKEKVALDGHLQLIICESMDFNTYGTVAHCTSAKKMWDLIEVLCEGTTEVRKNKKQILVSQYEAFMAQPKERYT